MKTNYRISGAKCSACKILIETECKKMPGVTACAFDVASGLLEVEHASVLDGSAVENVLRAAGNYRLG